MSIASIANSYLALNILILIGYFLFKFLKGKASFILELQYFSLIFFFFICILQPLLPGQTFTNSTVKVWAAKNMDDLNIASTLKPEVKLISLKTSEGKKIPEDWGKILALIIIGISLFTFIKLAKELLMLRKIKNTSYLLRKFGKIELLINDHVQTPFSFWLPGTYYTVIPTSFLANNNNFKTSLFHEFQHHRQGDTKFIYILLFLRALCFFNPFAHLMAKKIGETQELACDEKILESNKVSLNDYTSCLIQVAQTLVFKKANPVCAAGFCFNTGRHILRRRIEMMNVKQKTLAPWARKFSLGLVTMMATLTVIASQNFVQDKRISLTEANALAEKASLDSTFPITMNAEVLTQLNRFLGTHEGRKFMKSSLERKKEYDLVLTEMNEKYGTPYELNAIPIAESAYQNLPSRFSVKAAGLWMFIPSTARKFGMKVEGSIDERLNVRQQTEAAHRYLLSNKLIFNDWLLAIFAYNVGEGAVAKGIKKYGTKDVWELSKHVKGDKDYMAKVMASMIIMKNPELLY